MLKIRCRKLWAALLSGILILSLAGCRQETPPVSSLNVGESVDFSSYDPMGIIDGQGFYHYSPLVYETLLRFEEGKPVPCLAESWENEGNSWIFHLRRDVAFTDGRLFNAEAVKLNIEKLQEFEEEWISYYGGVSGIMAIETPEEYTVVFQYETPYYPVLQDLCAIPFGMLSPALFAGGNNPYGNIQTDTAGTGPYLLKKENSRPGKSYTFTRNPGYWGKVSGPDSFTVKIIPEGESRLMAMQAGEIDLLYGSYQVTYDMFDQLAGVQGLKAETSANLYATRNLLLNTAGEILGERKVRQAIQHGINKQQIIDTLLHAHEEKADYLFSRDLPFCDVDTVVYDYDPSQAAALLDEAGWNRKNDRGIRLKDGVPLGLTAIYMSERRADEQILNALKGQLAEIGMDLQIQGYETMTWYEKAMAGEFDISCNDTYAFPQDPYVFIAAMKDYGADYPAQQGLAQKGEIDARILSMLGTTDEKKLQDDVAYILTTLQEEAVNVPLSYLRELCVYTTEKIESVPFDSNGGFADISRVILH